LFGARQTGKTTLLQKLFQAPGGAWYFCDDHSQVEALKGGSIKRNIKKSCGLI